MKEIIPPQEQFDNEISVKKSNGILSFEIFPLELDDQLWIV